MHSPAKPLEPEWSERRVVHLPASSLRLLVPSPEGALDPHTGTAALVGSQGLCTGLKCLLHLLPVPPHQLLSSTEWIAISAYYSYNYVERSYGHQHTSIRLSSSSACQAACEEPTMQTVMRTRPSEADVYLNHFDHRLLIRNTSS
jgi:hypothetical protein